MYNAQWEWTSLFEPSQTLIGAPMRLNMETNDHTIIFKSEPKWKQAEAFELSCAPHIGKQATQID